MNRYRVYGIYTASHFIGNFEADSKEAAIAMAEGSHNDFAVLCHQCADEVELNDDVDSYQAELMEADE